MKQQEDHALQQQMQQTANQLQQPQEVFPNFNMFYNNNVSNDGETHLK